MEPFNPIEWQKIYTYQTVALVLGTQSYEIDQSVGLDLSEKPRLGIIGIARTLGGCSPNSRYWAEFWVASSYRT